MALRQTLEIEKESNLSATNLIDTLDEILDPTCNISIWKRAYAPAPLAIEELLKSNFKELQLVYKISQPIEVIADYIDETLKLNSQDAYHFLQDILIITKKFLEISNDSSIGIRLERVMSDNCKIFHTDFLKLRLICTYHGPATEWLENSNVNREYLGKGQNNLVVKNENLIQHMKTNWVGILKGDNYIDNAGKGVVHRSPQISHLNQKDRILLRIDTLDRYGRI